MSSVPGDFAAPFKCRCVAALEPCAPLQTHTITRRALAPTDVAIKVMYSGICHSDIHQARDEWFKGIFPMVPGHEIVGHVQAVGSAVGDAFKIGDIVGVGCMVGSCQNCENCKAGEEQFCKNGAVYTYNGTEKFPHMAEYNEQGGNPTYGGYSEYILADKSFVVKVPPNLDLAAAAPLLCAGITTYSPLKHYGLKAGQRFAVLGLGGLGHMGVKFGKAFDAHTTVISRGTSKKDSALNDLKADAFLDSTDAAAMEAAAGTFDFILDTVSAAHDINAYFNLLKTDGKLIMVGVAPETFTVSSFPLVFGRRTFGGSLIGGIKETQEMLEFCGKHNIVCDIELINASQINEAYERTVESDVKYRFVIDASTF